MTAAAKIKLTPAQIDFLQSSIDSFSAADWQVESAGSAGSDRSFLRLFTPDTCNKSYILMNWNSQDKDWERFLRFSARVGSSTGLPPRVFAADPRHGLILEEDLGKRTLKKVAGSTERVTDDVVGLYRRVLDALHLWQQYPNRVREQVTSRVFNRDLFLWETDYFAVHCVTGYFGCESLLDTAWNRERERLARHCANYPRVLIHRDFQSENIIVAENGVRFVDFQGARMGPAGYDLASLLLDPYLPVSRHLPHRELLDYFNRLPGGEVSDDEYYQCALQRLMQALGAYCNLSLHKGKERYRDCIAPALYRLTMLLENHAGYAAVKRIVAACLDKI